MEKVRAGLALFSVEKAPASHLTSYLLLLRVRGEFDSYCKIDVGEKIERTLILMSTMPILTV